MVLRAECRLKAIHPSNIAAATRSLLMAAGPNSKCADKKECRAGLQPMLWPGACSHSGGGSLQQQLPGGRTAAWTQCCTLLAHAIAYSSAGPGANRRQRWSRGRATPGERRAGPLSVTARQSL